MPLDSFGFVIPSYTDTPEETQVVRDLRALRELLSDPARWCQGALSRDSSGSPLFTATSDAAVSWCLVGGMLKIGTGDEAWDFLGRAARPSPRSTFNNTHTHAEVLALIDKAIEIAKS